MPIGGDGTFLLAAGRGCPIGSLQKPIVGFNSDPVRSEGRLMLPKQYSYDPKRAVQKLLSVRRLIEKFDYDPNMAILFVCAFVAG